MQTDVVECADGAIVLTGHYVRATGIFVDDVVANPWHVLLASGELPDIRPHFRLLEPHELGARVAFGRQGLRAAIGVAFLAEKLRHRPGILAHQLRPAYSGGPIDPTGGRSFGGNLTHTA